MRNVYKQILLLTLAWVGFGLSAIGWAAPMSAEQAATTVKAATGGKVLDIRKVSEQGRSMFLVKVLTEDSRVQIVQVDIETGQIVAEP